MPYQVMKKCSRCGEVKSLTSFHRLSSSKDGHRPDCKECCKKQRDQKFQNDKVKRKCDIMAHSIFSRLKYDVNLPKNKSYKEKNIKCTIGDTPKQVADYLYNHYYQDIKSLIDEGKTPSVDRIDSNGNYSPDNIRIIDWDVNVLEGARKAGKLLSKQIKSIKDDKVVVYNSISQASKELGIKRDTIYAHLNNGTSTRYGYKFESIKGESDETISINSK